MGGFKGLRLLLDSHIILWSVVEPEKFTACFQYFFCGGYPEIALLKDKPTQTRVLQDYFNTGLIITSDDKRQIEAGGLAINIMPAWEWLLLN